MEEIRRKILASKSFSSGLGQKKTPESIPRPQPPKPEVGAVSDSENNEEDEEFDRIMDATPLTDKTGLARLEKERGRATTAGRSKTVQFTVP